jgi:hypothetical protein
MPSSHLHLGNDPSLTYSVRELHKRFGSRVSGETFACMMGVRVVHGLKNADLCLGKPSASENSVRSHYCSSSIEDLI